MNTYQTKARIKSPVGAYASKDVISGYTALFTTLVLFSVMIVFPNIARAAVTDTLSLCAATLIPSLFPFMVLGEIFFAIKAERLLAGAIGGPFERLFKISGNGAAAFVLGAVCGLPLGGKYAITLYKNGSITKRECERLMGIATNCGIGFTVVGIGYTLWGSILFGWCLYLCQIFASISSGILLSRGENEPSKVHSIAPSMLQKDEKSIFAHIADAIAGCSVSMLKICAFCVFFSVIGSFISAACEIFSLPSLFSCTLLSFTEITLATSKLHAFFTYGGVYAVYPAKILTFFAVGFAGLSAHFQLTSFSQGLNLQLGRYYLTKLLCGLICALTGAIIMLFLEI